VDVEPAVAAEVVDYSSPRFLKSTKQVATVGPSSNTYEMLKKLYLAGVDVFRLNFSHGSHEEKSGLVDTMRKLEAELGRPVCILADLQGPKHRVGMYPEGDGSKVALTKGQTYRFDLDGDSPGDGDRVSLPHPDVMAALEVGHRVLIDDGKLTVVVTKKGDGFVETEVMNDAIISSRKGFNLPDTEVKSSPLTPKDRSDLEFIVKNLDVDWVALSFVQSPDDIVELRSLADEAAAPRKAKVRAR
jgi:pyruvate kinase